MNVRRIPNTTRQKLTASDGSAIERSYVYLPSSVWLQLQSMARDSGTSVSKIIQSFAISGAANSKEQNAQPTNRTSNAN